MASQFPFWGRKRQEFYWQVVEELLQGSACEPTPAHRNVLGTPGNAPESGAHGSDSP